MRKKLVSLILAAVMVLTAVPGVTVFAANVVKSGTCGANLTWTLTDDGTLTVSGTGDMEKWESDTDAPWYSNRSSITSVKIENSVTSIGGIYRLRNLARIDVESGSARFTSVDGVLFNKNKTILIQYPAKKIGTKYIIPNSVTSIGVYAFAECSSLTSISIPNSVTNISYGTFIDCSSLTSISIPNSVTNIGHWAFYACSSLTSISIPSNVTRIGASTFAECSSLTSISIPNSVTSIGDGAFEDCSSLTSISIPSSVTSIGDCALQRCSSLTSISIPNSVTSIGDCAFEDCGNLTSISISDSITSIRSRTFYRCSNLTSISIPSGVTSIGNSAFEGCSSLTNVYYTGTREQWEAIEGHDNIDTEVHYECTLAQDISKIDDSAPITAVTRNPSGEKTTYYSANRYINSLEGNIYDTALDLKKTYDEYLNAMRSEAKSKLKASSETMGEALLKSEKESEYKYLNFNSVNIPKDAKKAAYEVYADVLNEHLNKISIGKIDLNDPSFMIDAKLTKQILANLRGEKRIEKRRGWDVSLNLAFFGNLNTGIVKISKGNLSYSGVVVSKPEEVTEALNVLLDQLRILTEDVTKQAFNSLIAELGQISGISEYFRVEHTAILKETTKKLRKQGFGNIMKNVKKCYDGYETIKGVIAFKDSGNIKRSLENAESLWQKLDSLSYSDGDVDNFVIKKALEKIEGLRKKLTDQLYEYTFAKIGRYPQQPSFFDKVKSWIGSVFQCPVEFTVYGEDGEVLGYVRDGEVYYTDDIYIETVGDVKYLYVPQDLPVKIEMYGTDYGEFNYVTEEYVNGEPTGRMNYYDIPLTPETKITQELSGGNMPTETQAAVLQSDGGEIKANEYLPADGDSAVTVTTESSDKGVAIGGGEYPKGDCVELQAIVSDDDYAFEGWYIGEELVSNEAVYRFTAMEDVTVRAEFECSFAADVTYDVETDVKYESDFAAFVYTNSDGTNGIMLSAFAEGYPEEMDIYLTGTDENGNMVIENACYSAQQNEYGQYNFENVDLTNVTLAEIKDSTSDKVCTIKFSGGSLNSDSGVNLELLGRYANSAFATAKELDGTLTVEIDPVDGMINPGELTVYLAEYGSDSIVSVYSPEFVYEDEIYKLSIDISKMSNCKLMIWDNITPVTETLTVK